MADDGDPPTLNDHVYREEEEWFAATSMEVGVARAAQLTRQDNRRRWVFVVDDAGGDDSRGPICFVVTEDYGISDRRWARWLAHEYAGGDWDTVTMPVEVRPGRGAMFVSAIDSPGPSHPDDGEDSGMFDFLDMNYGKGEHD